MKKLTLATILATLSLPASALAASSSAVVLSVDSHHHTVQLVDAKHLVHAYRYRGRLPKLHVGSAVTFQRAGQTIDRIRLAAGGTRSVSFFAQVVRSSHHALVVRLADGRTQTFSSKQIAKAHHRPAKKRALRRARVALGLQAPDGGITINIQGLQPGATVLVTETIDPQGNLTITITLPAATNPPPVSTPVTGPEQHADGVVSEVGSDAFTLQTGDGSDLHLHMSQDALANLGLQPCDTVTASYHEAAGRLIADTVTTTGTSTSGDCAGDPAPGDPAAVDVVGSITQVSATGVTLSTQSQGSLSFTVDSADITSGYAIGDVVDVTYTRNGTTLDAGDVEYVPQDATGTVTAVSGGSVTITDAGSGQPETFTADPSQAMFDGVSAGDRIDVIYHQASGRLVADAVIPQAQSDG